VRVGAANVTNGALNLTPYKQGQNGLIADGNRAVLRGRRGPVLVPIGAATVTLGARHLTPYRRRVGPSDVLWGPLAGAGGVVGLLLALRRCKFPY